MRIVIDLQGAQTESRFRGIGKYSISHAKAIIRNRKHHDVLIALNGSLVDSVDYIRSEFNGILSQDKIRVWKGLNLVSSNNPSNEWRRNAMELVREAFLDNLNPDIVHISSFFEGYVDDAITSVGRVSSNALISMTHYDLIPLMNREYYLDSNPQYKIHYMNKIEQLRHCSLFLTLSEYSGIELAKNLKIRKEQIICVSAGLDDVSDYELTDVQKDELRKNHRISKQFLLYSGGYDPRKNLARLISAYAKLPNYLRDNYQLVLAGKISQEISLSLLSLAKKNNLKKDQIIITGYLSGSELTALYKMCSLYVFPSFHEGFGLPLIEAVAYGAPVIAANSTCIPEVLSTREALFDPFSDDEISNKILEVLNNESLRESLLLKQRSNLAKYSWDVCGVKTVEAFENIKKENEREKINWHSDKRLISEVANLSEVGCRPSKNDLRNTARIVAINFPQDYTPMMYVDVTTLVSRDEGTGIQRVVKSILKEWKGAGQDGWQVIPVYWEKVKGIDQFCIAEENIGDISSIYDSAYNKTTLVVEPKAGDVFLGLDLNSKIVHATNDGLFEDWRARGVKIHFIVYDILPIIYPKWWPSGGHKVHSNWLASIVQVSNSLICISKSVQKEVKAWIEKNNEDRRDVKVEWFHLGSDIEHTNQIFGLPDDASEALIRITARTSFLMVGTLEPRKGHSQVISAFELLWKKGYELNLIIVGKKGWLVDELVERICTHSEYNQRLIWLTSVSDEYLELIYQQCTCLIAASFAEGFGLPLIEAARNKLPIICRDIEVFREVVGIHGFYFDGSTSEQLADSVEEWLTLHEFNNHPLSAGVEWLNWNESAKALRDLLWLKKDSIYLERAAKL